MAVKVTVRPVQPGDCEILAAGLRQADYDEVLAASGQDPLTVLLESVALTPKVQAALFDGRLACIFGMAPLGLLGDTGAPWMLGTSEIDRHPSALMRHCIPYIAEMLVDRPHLINFVDARNVRSIRWLKRLGFEFHPAQPYGVAGLPFHRFEMRLENV